MCNCAIVHICAEHHIWAKTGGMRLDAGADFWGKKLVFSQTNSHLLSGGGSAKRATSAIIAAPSRRGCCALRLPKQPKEDKRSKNGNDANKITKIKQINMQNIYNMQL